MSKIIFETKRLYLREFLLSDFEEYSKITGDKETMKSVLNGKLHLGYSSALDVIEKYRKEYTQKPNYGYWALIEKESGLLIGDTGLYPMIETGEIELGYLLKREKWGLGLATEAASGAIKYGFERLNLKELVAVTSPENRASAKVLKKLGFNYEKTGNFHSRKSLFFRLKNKS